LAGKPEGRRPIGRPRYRWTNNISIDLIEIGLDGMYWMVWIMMRTNLELL
jgi:hypothetical protein